MEPPPDPPTKDFAGRFVELFWELRERDLNKWERLVAEELLIRSYGALPGKETVTIARLDAMAGVLGLSRGHLRDHLVSLGTKNVLANDETAGRPPRVWWFKDIALWTCCRRIEPGTDRARRAEAGNVELHDDNLPSDERPLPGFEPKLTDPEVQADANLEHVNHGSRPALSAAASGPGSFGAAQKSRTRNGYGGTRNGYGNPVPEMGTVPETGTEALDNARASCARSGFQKPGTEAWQPGTALPAEGARKASRWRPLTSGENALLFELQEWFRSGPDTEELIAHFRESWEGRIRWDSGLVRRTLLDVQQEVREKPGVVKHSRGGLMHTRYNEFLRLQPPKPHRPGKTPTPTQPAIPLVPSARSTLSWEEAQTQVAAEKEKFLRNIRGGPTP